MSSVARQCVAATQSVLRTRVLLPCQLTRTKDERRHRDSKGDHVRRLHGESVAFNGLESAEETTSTPPSAREPAHTPPPVRISPLATALTLAVVGFAIVIGITGPRLRDRQGPAQPELPLGELATIAAMHEARALSDIMEGRSREAALAKIPELIKLAALDKQPMTAADLSTAGWMLEDARNAELAPGVTGTMVLYRHEDSGATLSVVMLPDQGRAVRFDGFGRAVALAPGDEWLETVAEDFRGRTAYALADGRILWLVLAERPSALTPVAKLLR